MGTRNRNRDRLKRKKERQRISNIHGEQKTKEEKERIEEEKQKRKAKARRRKNFKETLVAVRPIFICFFCVLLIAVFVDWFFRIRFALNFSDENTFMVQGTCVSTERWNIPGGGHGARIVLTDGNKYEISTGLLAVVNYDIDSFRQEVEGKFVTLRCSNISTSEIVTIKVGEKVLLDYETKNEMSEEIKKDSQKLLILLSILFFIGVLFIFLILLLYS